MSITSLSIAPPVQDASDTTDGMTAQAGRANSLGRFFNPWPDFVPVPVAARRNLARIAQDALDKTQSFFSKPYPEMTTDAQKARAALERLQAMDPSNPGVDELLGVVRLLRQVSASSMSKVDRNAPTGHDKLDEIERRLRE